MKNTKKKDALVSSEHWIVKSNVLNEVRNTRMTISQVRLFSIYLSKINPLDENSREVTLKLDEYTKIMQFKQTNTTRLMKAADELLELKVTYFDKDGQYNGDGLVGFVKCQIFKRFRLYKNADNEWLVTIDCHDDVVKLMFDLQKYYFKYQLWNALQLTSANQQRMYEILKQYEYAGIREISLKDLREFLGIAPGQYPRWESFKTKVLNATQEALANYTDIKFTWEVTKRSGKGGKVDKIRFEIEKNNDYAQRITLDEYLINNKSAISANEPVEFKRPDDGVAAHEKTEDNYFAKEIYPFIAEACDNEFKPAEMQVLYNMIINIVPHRAGQKTVIQIYDYLKRKYDELKWQATRRPIKSRFGYLKKLIDVDLKGED